jgi:hypothetical protein
VSNLPGAETTPLPQRLRDLQRRSRAVLGHELVRHPAAAPLHSLGRILLQNERRILAAWRSWLGTSDGSHEVAIENLVLHSHGLLDSLVNQIALCDATARQSLAVLEFAKRLIALEPVRHIEILPLFHRVFDEVQPAAALERLVPSPGLALATLIASRAGSDAAFFVEGLTAARLLIWTLHDNPRAAERLPVLALAALLQDVGRLSTATGPAARRRRDEKRTEWLERHHPAIGAALLGSISGAPVELVFMAGQHHERLDGGGFPRALASRDILPDAAVLAAATRFARLGLGLDEAPTSSGAAGNTLASIAELLLAEAKWGYWPVDFAGRLARRLAAAEQTSASRTTTIRQVPAHEAATPANAEPAASPDEGRSRRLHDKEAGLPAAHAAIGGRFSSSGWYAKKMLIDPRGP